MKRLRASSPPNLVRNFPSGAWSEGSASCWRSRLPSRGVRCAKRRSSGASRLEWQLALVGWVESARPTALRGSPHAPREVLPHAEREDYTHAGGPRRLDPPYASTRPQRFTRAAFGFTLAVRRG